MKISTRFRLLGAVYALAARLPLPSSAQDAALARTYWPTDGWQTADPEDDGMHPDLLAQVGPRLEEETPLLSAFVAVHRGALVYESYYNGFQPDELMHTWSVSKSITGIVTGIAFREGLLTDTSQTLRELIPDRIPAEADPRVAGITLDNLLTMTGGWEWNSGTNFQRHDETDDLDFCLTRPMACDPGTCFEYDSGCPNLLSYIIQDRSGQTMAEFARTRLFEPLGITQFDWFTTPQGYTRGAGGLSLTPLDSAKLGFLFLNNGQWDQDQIVGQSWVETSTTGHSSGDSAATGVNIGGGVYGYQWWISETSGHPVYYASGFGGQFIYVVTDLDLVVVTGVAGADATEPELAQRPRPIIEELIIPSVLES